MSLTKDQIRHAPYEQGTWTHPPAAAGHPSRVDAIAARAGHLPG